MQSKAFRQLVVCVSGLSGRLAMGCSQTEHCSPAAAMDEEFSVSPHSGRPLDSETCRWNPEEFNGWFGHLCKVLDYGKLQI